MCTVTWRLEEDGYELFFNRDELRTRLPATPPEIREHGGRPFIAPSDGDFGGTWISVNGRGVALALLNGYDPADYRTDRNYESRGTLVAGLADAGSVSEVERCLDEAQLGPFRSFRLLTLGPDRGSLTDWRHEKRSRLPLETVPLPLVSSSFETDVVGRSRSEQFAALAPGRGPLENADYLRFHRGHLPRRGAHSVCMHRPNAHTVSFSWIRVDTNFVRFFYTPHAPHAGVNREDAVTLPRLSKRANQ